MEDHFFGKGMTVEVPYCQQNAQNVKLAHAQEAFFSCFSIYMCFFFVLFFFYLTQDTWLRHYEIKTIKLPIRISINIDHTAHKSFLAGDT